jgi:hypothetical protein
VLVALRFYHSPFSDRTVKKCFGDRKAQDFSRFLQDLLQDFSRFEQDSSRFEQDSSRFEQDFSKNRAPLNTDINFLVDVPRYLITTIMDYQHTL